jgi:multidrug efflux pump subunit AcrA (membrane-fusion protein)
MTTEIEVANPDLKLVPGMYASVSIPVECRPLALVVPIEAVPPGETSSVYVINSNGEIEDRPVKLGIQTPTKFEVLSGLKEGELVLTGSRSLFKPGQKVVPKLLDPLAQQE